MTLFKMTVTITIMTITMIIIIIIIITIMISTRIFENITEKLGKITFFLFTILRVLLPPKVFYVTHW